MSFSLVPATWLFVSNSFVLTSGVVSRGVCAAVAARMRKGHVAGDGIGRQSQPGFRSAQRGTADESRYERPGEREIGKERSRRGGQDATSLLLVTYGACDVTVGRAILAATIS